jgi:general stress protein CsbA
MQTPTQNQIINKIVALIKKRKAEAVKFIISHGGSVKKTDSDIIVGQKLSSVLSSSGPKTKEDFAKLLHESSLQADGDAASDAAYYTQGGVGTPIVSTQTAAGGAISGASKGASAGGTFGAILGGVTGLFGTASTNKAATQQSSDAITLALINASIQKQKTPAVVIISIVVFVVIILVIGLLLYLKNKKS